MLADKSPRYYWNMSINCEDKWPTKHLVCFWHCRRTRSGQKLVPVTIIPTSKSKKLPSSRGTGDGGFVGLQGKKCELRPAICKSDIGPLVYRDENKERRSLANATQQIKGSALDAPTLKALKEEIPSRRRLTISLCVFDVCLSSRPSYDAS